MTLFHKKDSVSFVYNTPVIISILIFITIFKLFVLSNSPLELSVDEAQYWDWSNDLQFGYFTKPPFIAWLISFSTYIFGNSEFGIRFFSPILHLLIAFILWYTCFIIYGNNSGKFTALIWITLPLTSLGSFIISTDTPLLFFWSLSLLALTKIIKNKNFFWSFVLGILISLGFLTKYAMLYFIILLLIFWLIYDRNKFIELNKLFITFAVLFIFSLPNIHWNYVNEFSTFNHVIYNADLEHINYNLIQALTFLLSQFFVLGPIVFLTFIIIVWSLFFKEIKLSLLAFFSVTILLILTIQAFLKTSNANWAVTAYPAACIMIGGYLAEKKSTAINLFIKTGILINIFISIFIFNVAFFGKINLINLDSDPLRKLRGFETQSKELIEIIKKENPDALIFNRRSEITRFNYYMREYISPSYRKYYLTEASKAKNHYEYFSKFKIEKFKSKQKIIIVTRDKGINNKYLNNFEDFELVYISKFKNSENTYRVLYFFKGVLR